MSPPAAWLQQLRAAPPPDAVVDDPDVVAGYSRDMAMLAPNGRPSAVVFPASTAEVSVVLRIASAHRVPVVPRGAGSGLAGSANGVDAAIMLSMVRMDAILEVDPANRLAVVQPGVIKTLRDAAEEQSLFYPPDPSSFDWCTIGGNLATNAGGLCCVKYGVTSDFVLGIEVVLADGEVLRTGHRTVKGVAGYDLARLFVGSEGTLGVITEATLALRPKPHAPVTLVAIFDSTAAAGRAVEAIVTGGLVPSLLELMDRTCIRAVGDMAKMDLDRDAAALLVAQSDSGGERAAQEIAAVAAACEQVGATFVHHADDAAEGAMLLHVRRIAVPALGQLGTTLIDDVAVPRSRISEFLDRTAEIAQQRDVIVGVVGHAGDGNMHPTICFDPNDADENARAFAAFKRHPAGRARPRRHDHRGTRSRQYQDRLVGAGDRTGRTACACRNQGGSGSAGDHEPGQDLRPATAGWYANGTGRGGQMSRGGRAVRLARTARHVTAHYADQQ